MKAKIKIMWVALLGLTFSSYKAIGQTPDSVWTLQKCIDYAYAQNITIQKSVLTSQTNQITYEEAKASRLPSLSATASQEFSWSRSLDANKKYSSYSNTSTTSYGLTSSMSIYKGGKINNTIKQENLATQASQFDVETEKETISLSILNAYLEVLYAQELVKNSEKQVESLQNQVEIAEERFKLGAISKSDYLQVKAELSTEKLTLANAQSTLTIDKVTLMQLMDLPVSDNFSIVYPDLSGTIFQTSAVEVDTVYNTSLTVKPQIKSAELNRQIADIDINIAKAAYLPVLTLSAGVYTGFSSPNGLAFDYESKNEINPSISFSLTIPIFQNKSAKGGVAIARIKSQSAALTVQNTKNELRKDIEQACANLKSALIEYQANLESFSSSEEAYNVSKEKYEKGAINSVDFIIQRTSYITAESELLQSKYKLVSDYKILDFYLGKPLSL
jgi:outer membrane protein